MQPERRKAKEGKLNRRKKKKKKKKKKKTEEEAGEIIKEARQLLPRNGTWFQVQLASLACRRQHHHLSLRVLLPVFLSLSLSRSHKLSLSLHRNLDHWPWERGVRSRLELYIRQVVLLVRVGHRHGRLWITCPRTCRSIIVSWQQPYYLVSFSCSSSSCSRLFLIVFFFSLSFPGVCVCHLLPLPLDGRWKKTGIDVQHSA